MLLLVGFSLRALATLILEYFIYFYLFKNMCLEHFIKLVYEIYYAFLK